MQNKVIKFIGFGPLFFIPAFVYMIIFFVAKENKNDFEKMLSKVEIDLIYTKKQEIKTKVDSIIDLIEYENLTLTQDVTQALKNENETATKILLEYIKENRPKVSQEKLLEGLKNRIQHFKNSEILTQIKIQGTQELPSRKQEQIHFMKALDNTPWHVVSKVNMVSYITDKNSDLLKIIKRVNIDAQHYFFVMNAQGELLLDSFNQKLLDTQSIFNNARQSLNNNKEAFISYIWKSVDGENSEKRFSFVKKVPSTSWIIGIGFQESTIRNIASNNTVALYSDYEAKINYIIIFGIVSIVFSLLVSFLISRYLDRTFIKYNKEIKQKEFELTELNNSLEKKVAIRTKELEASKKELEELATTDSLTQIHNRYAIMQRLTEELRRNVRYKAPFSVLMYDLDHFKKVNDTYGHDVGDYVLAQSVAVIKTLLREVDIMGRYGGEEFLIILPNTHLDDALIVAERIRASIENYKFEHIEQLTLSIGAVEYTDPNEDEPNLLKRVDEHLYKAKHSGRNKVSG